jgi:hypothetical protein
LECQRRWKILHDLCRVIQLGRTKANAEYRKTIEVITVERKDPTSRKKIALNQKKKEKTRKKKNITETFSLFRES